MEQIGAGARLGLAGTGTGCVVCGLDQNANQILLCDGCDAEYHTYCLVPPLKEIPEGDFYCKSCKDAKRHLTGKAATAGAVDGPTAAGLTVQDEQGRMVPVRSEDVRESKYKGVLKLLHKGAKKPFVARIEKDRKFVQLGLFSSEIEAAHAFDKAAIQMFGRDAQLNFPHLHDGFVRASSAEPAAARPQAPHAAASTPATLPPTAASMASPSFGTPGRGRGRGRGRGSGGRGSRGGATAGGGGRGKRRLEDSPVRDLSTAASSDATPNSAAKKRKALATGGDETPITTGPKYLGVQVFRGYAHAQITVNGKIVNLGTFPTAVDAATAYDKAALKYFGGEMGSKDAQHDRIVLNFPNKRAELLKQLIEENMHQKARQASGSSTHAGSASSTSANRSMQSAKHNLSIKKLENWVLKLQRSVKLVEAAHRVKWDGLPLVKPEEQTANDESEAQPEIKLELLSGAGPTITTDFTKKQQRLRSGATDIENAVNLMIQELKIYADDTPMDNAFIPPPRSHALLDLMSTSRFLKLASTINELAHFDVTNDGATKLGAEDASSDESFEALVQTVVDYRARLQMAASAEKQKLAGLVDSESTESTSPRASASSNAASTGTAESGIDVLSREMLQSAKYVKRKVQRIRKVKKVTEVIEASTANDEEQKEHESVSTTSGNEATAMSESKEEATPEAEAMDVDQIEEQPADVDADVSENTNDADAESAVKPEEAEKEDITADEIKAQPEEATAAEKLVESAPTASIQTSDEPSSDSSTAKNANDEDQMPAETLSKESADAEKKVEDLPPVDSATTSTSESTESAPVEAVDVIQAGDSQSASLSDAAPAASEVADADQAMEDAPSDEGKETNPAASTTVDLAAEMTVGIAAESKHAMQTPHIVTPAPVAEETEEVVEEVWEYCLALKPQAATSRNSTDTDGLWRLLPLQSEKGEFVEDVFLTDEEVSEIEVAEAEVCGVSHKDGGNATDTLTSTPPLIDLHKNEVALRDRVKVEADRRAALEGVIKIEQERLSQVFVVYRRMLEGITIKASEAEKKHQRITRDLLLVELMKQTFAPILDELLGQCDVVFLQRLEKLSDRFEDFQQEFDYYTDALVSVSGGSKNFQMRENGHMKGEADPAASSDAVEDMDVDEGEESLGLRDAYVSFYMDEIEALWKERCRAVESLHAILRSLSVSATENPSTDDGAALSVVAQPTSTTLLHRRVHENLEQWKSVVWPTQLATPPFMNSFMGDGSSRRSVTVSNQTERNPINTALGELKQIIIDLTQESPSSTASRVIRHSTLVVYHPVFLEHQTPKDHPECPERLNRIITMLNSVRKKYDTTLKIDRLTQSPEELSPSDSILLAVHSPAYLQQLKDRSKEASNATEQTSRGVVSVASSALVFETNRGTVALPAAGLSGARASPTGSMGGAFGASSMPTGIAMDTYVSSKSWDVARAAAGTVCLAVDRVVRKEYRNAACLIRPPGHHVGRHGRTLDAPSSGFCLLNNVVIGAVHARQYPWIRRVAVLDWDIHHGNGTEELMRDDPDGFFASVHLYASGKYFPGTGKGEHTENLVNVALENSGAGSGSGAFRGALTEEILPAMRAFRPDIIFISAGFDGHKDDILGGRAAVKNTAVPAGYLEDDYVWATQEVLKLADECCDGRVVSVLEGGYDVRKETNSLAKSVGAHVGAIAAYEQERQQKNAEEATTELETMAKIKSESSTGVLLSLLAKDMNDNDVVIIDDDEDDEDETTDKSGLLANGDVDVHDEDEDLDDEVDDDGVEVDEEDDGVHGDDRHHGDDVDEDVVMTDEDHDGQSIEDDDGDAHSTGLSFAASLSVDGEDDDAHHSQEDVEGGETVMDELVRSGDDTSVPVQENSRIATPDYDPLDGTGDDDVDDNVSGTHVDEPHDDDNDHGDMLGDEDHDAASELPSLS